MPALEMRDVRKVYAQGDEDIVALSHASLTVGDDEIVALVIAVGRIWCRSRGTLPPWAPWWIGVVGGFIVGLTSVGSGTIFGLVMMIAFPLTAAKIVGTIDNHRGKWDRALAQIEAAPFALYNLAAEKFARALALSPDLLILDEPTAGLDPDRSERFVQLIKRLREDHRFAMVMVTHDLDTLFELTDRVAVLADQHIIACDSLAAVRALDHKFVQNFFGGDRGKRALEHG